MDDDRTELLTPGRPTAGIHVRLLDDHDRPGSERTFASTFRIGRHPDCELHVDAAVVSRFHVAVEWDGSRWRLRDLGSANGTLVDGVRITAPVDLGGTTRVRLGPKGPSLELTTTAGAEPPRRAPRRPDPPPAAPPPSSPAPRPTPTPPPARPTPSTRRSLDEYARRYLSDEDDEDTGDHTRMVRKLIQGAKTGQRRRLRIVVAAAAVIAVGLGGLAIQQLRVARQRGAELDRLKQIVDDLFLQGKTIDVQLAQLRTVIEETERTDLRTQLDRLAAERARLAETYEGYVNELGSYRKLTPRERLMHRVARVFNEAETSMPSSFVNAVEDMLDDYWLTTAGRTRFQTAFDRLRASGDLPFLVETLEAHGLPRQLVYVALQESNFDPHAVGPQTRWGRAKGMWQIIPMTARRFGLDPGPTPDASGIDERDDRLDVRRATVAAARYLQTLYGTFAQASGLLTIAAYNWGEHRVLPRLDGLADGGGLDDDDGLAIFADVPEDPASRTYWRFFVEYQHQIPDETKDYVLKIFSAAVLGEDPHAFGLEMANPLATAVEARPGAERASPIPDPWATR